MQINIFIKILIYVLLFVLIYIFIIKVIKIFFKKNIHEKFIIYENPEQTPDEFAEPKNLSLISSELEKGSGYSLPSINFDDYSELNINLSSNDQEVTNNETIHSDRSPNDLIQKKINILNDKNDKNDGNIIKKFKKTEIYGTLAWTNYPDFYIP
jgi:hypothetical protein